MLISYYANKKSSPRLPSWQPSLIFFNIPIESGTIIKPCTLKHFQVTYMLHKDGYWTIWPHFYQTRSAWSVDQGSNKNHSPAYNFAPTVTKFCVMWEGLSLPHDTKFGNCRCRIVDSRAFPSWSLIHGLRWSGLIKAEPGHYKEGPL